MNLTEQERIKLAESLAKYLFDTPAEPAPALTVTVSAGPPTWPAGWGCAVCNSGLDTSAEAPCPQCGRRGPFTIQELVAAGIVSAHPSADW